MRQKKGKSSGPRLKLKMKPLPQHSPTKSGRGKGRKYTKESLLSAVEAVKKGMVICQAAKLFDIPDQTLRDRIHKQIDPDKFARGPDRLLNKGEENRLVKHFQNIADIGYVYNRVQVIDLASEVVIELGKKPECAHLSNCWLYPFIRRSPELKELMPATIAGQKRQACKQNFVVNYYDALEKLLDKHKLRNESERIYLLDITEVCPEEAAGEGDIILTNNDAKVATIIACGNAAGTSIPPYFVFQRTPADPSLVEDLIQNSDGEDSDEDAVNSSLVEVAIQKSVCGNTQDRSSMVGELPSSVSQQLDNDPSILEGALPNSAYTITTNGRCSSGVIDKFLCEHLMKFTDASSETSKTESIPILMLYDGYKFPITPFLIDKAEQLNILLFPMPAHAAYLMNTLGSELIPSIKSLFLKECDVFLNGYPSMTVTRCDICQIACKVYQKAFMTVNLVSAFTVWGISPFNTDCPSVQSLPAVKQMRKYPKSQAAEKRVVPKRMVGQKRPYARKSAVMRKTIAKKAKHGKKYYATIADIQRAKKTGGKWAVSWSTSDLNLSSGEDSSDYDSSSKNSSSENSDDDSDDESPPSTDASDDDESDNAQTVQIIDIGQPVTNNVHVAPRDVPIPHSVTSAFRLDSMIQDNIHDQQQTILLDSTHMYIKPGTIISTNDVHAEETVIMENGEMYIKPGMIISPNDADIFVIEHCEEV